MDTLLSRILIQTICLSHPTYSALSWGLLSVKFKANRILTNRTSCLPIYKPHFSSRITE